MFFIYFCFFYQQVAAQAGQKVHLVDIDGEAISKAEKRIADSLQRVAKKKFKVLLYLHQFCMQPSFYSYNLSQDNSIEQLNIAKLFIISFGS